MEVFCIVMIVCLAMLGEVELKKSKENYKKLEKKYNELAEKTGNAELATTYISESDLLEIKKLKDAGNDTRAIKRVRELTDMDLLEAKQYVEKLGGEAK